MTGERERERLRKTAAAPGQRKLSFAEVQQAKALRHPERGRRYPASPRCISLEEDGPSCGAGYFEQTGREEDALAPRGGLPAECQDGGLSARGDNAGRRLRGVRGGEAADDEVAAANGGGDFM